MSELNDMVRVYVGDADVVTVPLVDNLTASNAAPKASTVGAALAQKVDTDSVMEHVSITVDGIASDNQGVILINGDDIPIDDTQDADDIKTYVDAIGAKTAEDIIYESGETATIKEVVDALAENIEDVSDNLFASEIKMSSSDTTTVAEKITAIDGKTAADIPMGSADTTKISAKIAGIEEDISDLEDGQVGTVKISSQTFTDGEQNQARANIGAAAKTETVLVNESQTLNATQQAQARTNIAAIGTGEAVLVAEQTLTDAQKLQARTNIGAVADSEMPSFRTELFIENGLTFECARWGRVGYVTFHSGRTTNAADANESIVTLPVWCRPCVIYSGLNSGTSTHERIMFKTDGSVEGSSAIAANTMIRISAAFVCANYTE